MGFFTSIRNLSKTLFAILAKFFACIRRHWKVLFASVANFLAGISLLRRWPIPPRLIPSVVFVLILVVPDWKSLVRWRQNRPPVRKTLKEGWPALLFLVSLSFYLNELPWFQHFEYALLDSFTRGQSQARTQDIFVVEITKQDHRMFLNSQGGTQDPSALDPSKVLDLIKALREAGAKVIGVDIDTCDDPSSCDKNRSPAGWVSVGAQIKNDIDTIWAEVPDPESGPCLKLNPILGEQPADCHGSGIVRFEQEDGIVRGQQAQYLVCGGTKANSEFPSFHAAVAAKCLATKDCTQHGGATFLRRLVPGTERAYLNFEARDLRVEPASNFVQPGTNGLETRQRKPEERLPGIVLIGGSYEASDNYLTPIGRMPGVELLAEAVESDLQGSITPAEWWPLRIGELPLDACAGFLIMLLYSLWNRPGALVFSLVGMMVVLVLTGLVFYGLKIWINPIFVMAGMLAHQEYEAARKEKKESSPQDMLLAEALEHETDRPD